MFYAIICFFCKWLSTWFCKSKKITNCHLIVVWPFKSLKNPSWFILHMHYLTRVFKIPTIRQWHPFNIRRNSHRSDIKCTPDLPLNRYLLSSSHKNARALQKHKIKIIENMKIQTENFFGILIWTRLDRIEKVFG